MKMPRLRKPQLFEIVEQAILDSGWSFLHLNSPDQHPARYQVFRDDRSYRVKIYIWNLTHGGGAARPADEYRIQITGLPEPSGSQEFFPEIGGKTLILGWWDDVGVFAGFDYNFHAGPLGKSPSIQIREDALQSAHINGFAPHNRGNGELAIAFRPGFLTTYIENLEALHSTGASPSEIDLLQEISDDPDSVDDSEIEEEIPQERQYAIIHTKRALRDSNFRDRVLTAYGNRCAMCGLQLKLLDAAHILPVDHPDSTDQTCNGVALCTLHHRAFDRAFVTFDAQFKTYLDDAQVEEYKKTGHDGGIDEFRKQLLPLLILPPDKKERPKADFITAVNTMRGWQV
jgi:putative restriction endonuclease